jgi:hypothetical protein
MIGWCYKTFQSSFRLNKFIFGPFRSRMRAPHPSRGSPTGDVWKDIPQGTWTVLLRHVLEKQLTDILKRWISNVATLEIVRGKKIRERGGNTGKKYGKKVQERKVRGKKYVCSVCGIYNRDLFPLFVPRPRKAERGIWKCRASVR